MVDQRHPTAPRPLHPGHTQTSDEKRTAGQFPPAGFEDDHIAPRFDHPSGTVPTIPAEGAPVPASGAPEGPHHQTIQVQNVQFTTSCILNTPGQIAGGSLEFGIEDAWPVERRSGLTRRRGSARPGDRAGETSVQVVRTRLGA